MTLSQAFDLALQRHQAGRLVEAEALYRQILAAEPNHTDALHLMGVVAHQAGRHDLAVEWICRALSTNPNHPAAYSNLGEAFRAMGRLDEAIANYRRALDLRPECPETHNNLGMALARQGWLNGAVTAYRRALQIKPDSPKTHNNLGIALRELGQLDEAIAEHRLALQLQPDDAEACNNLAAVLIRQGQFEAAVTACRRALELQPAYAEACNNLGAAFAGQGQLDDAVTAYRRALRIKPDLAQAHNNLGIALRENGQSDEAIAACRRAVELKSDYAEAHHNLGDALKDIGHLDQAIAAYYRAIQIRPDLPEAHHSLAIALRERGQFEEAVAECLRAIELKPDYAEGYNNLGASLACLGRLDEAIAAYRRALQARPSLAEAYNNLGVALRDRGQLDEAIAAYRRALELKPAYPQAHNNLGNALKDQGQLDEAIAEFRRALRAGFPGSEAHSNLAYTLHFHPGHHAGTIAAESERWNRQFGEPLKQFILPHANNWNPGRRLRIGYVSPDFRDHVIGRNLLPLFQRHDRRNFEILCYAGVARPDPMTDEFRRLASQWQSTIGMGDQALADLIRRDGVDILVDLTQHMAGNRLPVFARQPAPVQVSFAGYPDTTGLEQIEYRISDRYLEQQSADETTGQQERVCLIESFWCYDPCGIHVEINRPPAKRSGIITFGNLGNFCKVNEPILKLWARVLANVKHSRLLISSPAGSHRKRTLQTLEGEGVEAHRVDFVERRPRREYLELYHRLDIVLDTLPYNGHTTSLDALWMGVPVVSLAGETRVSRAGLSQLTNLGRPELIAHSENDYVSIASELASDFPRLAQLRATMRHRMENSVLMDALRFARNIEAAYRSMWETYKG